MITIDKENKPDKVLIRVPNTVTSLPKMPLIDPSKSYVAMYVEVYDMYQIHFDAHNSYFITLDNCGFTGQPWTIEKIIVQ